MESLKNKIVFITGASSGIGKACAETFAAEGCKLIISARSFDKIKELSESLAKKFGVRILPLKIDVSKRDEVKNAIDGMPPEWKNIDILINNAGLAIGLNYFYEDDIDNWEAMIDTNIKGLLYVTRAIIDIMVKRKSGHIINLGSIAGNEPYQKGAVYCATKHAVKAINEALKMDVVDKNIRVSSIDPGMVETNFSVVRFHGDKEKAKNVYKGLKPLTAQDIADVILFIANRPPHVNLNQIIIMPTAQASAKIAHREE